MEGGKISFVHLSDLHFAKDSGRCKPFVQSHKITDIWKNIVDPPSFDEALVYKFCEFMDYELKDDFDFFLLSGDLATTGDASDLEVARWFVDGVGFYETVFGVTPLSDINNRIILIPGNHDRYKGRGNAFSPGGEVFDNVFSDYVSNAFGVSCQIVTSDDGFKVALVLADFSLKSFVSASRGMLPGIWGQGKVTDAHLIAIQSKVQQIRKDIGDIPIVFVCHYAPAFPSIKNSLKLLNDDGLLGVLRSAGVSAVFCGHTHESQCYSAGGVWISCSGTAFEVNEHEKNSFNIVDLLFDSGGENIKNIVIKKYSYDFRSDKFLFSNRYAI